LGNTFKLAKDGKGRPSFQFLSIAQTFQHRDLIAILKFRAAQALFPGLQWKQTAIDFLESELGEETWNIREGKQR
jgi:hypothetical protein